MYIGPYHINPPLLLAPMAGVTDQPFRMLCRSLGAGLAASEMTTANPRLWNTAKSRTRMDLRGESTPIAVQIAGADPAQLAAAARHHVQQGAQIIDINMGCPAKKVCHVWAGSALLQDEPLVGQILKAVVAAVNVPVTLKIRTGWDQQRRNALRIARLAENCGIAALAIHGRTRADHYQGRAEYDTIAEVKAAIRIPVIANGDIDSPEKALEILRYTAVDALMIGRAAQGRPWIFHEIDYFLTHGKLLPEPTPAAVGSILLQHLDTLYRFYGATRGIRIARKHLGWYARNREENTSFRRAVNRAESSAEQWRLTRDYFASLQARLPFAA